MWRKEVKVTREERKETRRKGNRRKEVKGTLEERRGTRGKETRRNEGVG